MAKLRNRPEGNYIEASYWMEVYRFLDEDQLKPSISAHPKVDKETLEDYFQSLRQFLARDQETHKKVSVLKNMGEIATSEIPR